jgi:hypothetical protein
MIQVEITDEMLLAAREKATEMGELNNSILKGQGSLAGFVGEQVVMKILGGKWENTYDYDINVDNVRVEVKTKQTTVQPLPHYECSVAAFNIKQNCDAYAFVRVLKDFSVGWFLGVMKKDEFFQKAKRLKKGEVDPSNNFTVRADCYNLRIDELGDSI